MMKRGFVFVVLMGLFALSGHAQAPVYLYTWENASIGAAPDPYVPGAAEIDQGDLVSVKNFGGDGPAIVDAAGLGISDPNGYIQTGSKALALDSGGTSEGYVVDMANDSAIAPQDMTVEAIFYTKNSASVPGNTVDLQYVIGSEWPFGASHQFMLRIHGTGAGANGEIRYHTDRGDGGLDEYVQSASAVPSNQWVHVAAVLNYNDGTPAESQIQLYVDGVSQGTSPYDASGNAWSVGSSHSTLGPSFAIGYSLGQDINASDHRGLNGAIDAVAITSAALNSASFKLADFASSVNEWDQFE